MKLIGILGRKRVGKDTTADYLTDNYDFTKFAIAQPIKDSCKIAFNLSDYDVNDGKDIIHEKWNKTPREILIWYGTDMFRKEINNFIPNTKDNHWINLAINKYDNLTSKNENAKVVFSDVRFQNCIDVIHNNGGIIIKIVNDNGPKDAFEDHIDNLVGDYLIVNHGTHEDLYKKIEEIITTII